MAPCQRLRGAVEPFRAFAVSAILATVLAGPGAGGVRAEGPSPPVPGPFAVRPGPASVAELPRAVLGPDSGGSARDTSCSARYSAALAELRQPLSERLARAVAAAGEAEPAMSGRWRVPWPARLLTGPSRDGRACADAVSYGGRTRCRRWEAEGAAASQPDIAPSPEEMRLVRRLDGFVGARGRVEAFGKNGRHYWTIRRVSDGLGSYMGQPQHEALCSGASEMLDFYAGRLAGVTTYTRETGEAADRLSALALARAEAIGGIGSTAALGPEDGSAVRQLAGLIVGGGRKWSRFADREAEAEFDAAMAAASEALVEAQRVEALPARDRVAVALRVIEAARYAVLLASKVAAVEDALRTTIAEVRSAHARECTCRSVSRQ